MDLKNKAVSVTIFIISPLYKYFTPKLKSVMGELISFCFKGGIKNSLGSQGATSTRNHQKYRMSFNKTLSKSAINYLLDSCNFILGSICFCQLTEMVNYFNP